MENFPFEEYKNDFIIKTIVQEKQYEQWLKAFFFLNNELTNEYDFVYQDAFYVKFYELFTEGLIYANRILTSLKKGNNSEKLNWYLKFVDGLNSLRAELSDSEFLYIEYRRHSASHIFQNSYEHIQENLRIKKERNGKKLEEIKTEIENLILKYGSDKNVDKHINSKLQLKISELHKQLT
jgi:hypothetical protein